MTQQATVTRPQHQQTVDECLNLIRLGMGEEAQPLAVLAGKQARQLGLNPDYHVPFGNPALAALWFKGYGT